MFGGNQCADHNLKSLTKSSAGSRKLAVVRSVNTPSRYPKKNAKQQRRKKRQIMTKWIPDILVGSW
jgi:hypothetical protein